MNFKHNYVIGRQPVYMLIEYLGQELVIKVYYNLLITANQVNHQQSTTFNLITKSSLIKQIISIYGSAETVLKYSDKMVIILHFYTSEWIIKFPCIFFGNLYKSLGTQVSFKIS